MTLEDAQQLALAGSRYGDLFAALENDDSRRMFKAWWPWATAHVKAPPLPQENVVPTPMFPKLPPVYSGNGCKTCGGLMVRGGKCEYCPNGCGSEGECS